MSEEKRLGWNDTIEHDGEEFMLLPDGSIVEFKVLQLEKSSVSQGEMKGCPMAKLKLQCTCDEGQTVITSALVLHTKLEWKLCEFFTAIGQRKHGERLKPRWNEVVGATGKARLAVGKYTVNDGKEQKVNRVKKYLNPEDEESQVEDKEEDDGLPF